MNKPIILHLFSDEKVVNRNFSEYIECLPNFNHIGLLFTDREVKHSTNPNFIIIRDKKSSDLFKKNNLSEVKYVIIHYLTPDKLRFILTLPKRIKICWFIYGGDLYNRYLVECGYNLYFNKKNSITIKRILKKFIRRIEFNFVVYRIDIFACNKSTIQLIQKYSMIRKELMFVELFAYTIENTLGILKNQPFQQGNSIIIGNSASITNNHNYVYEYIKNIEIINPIILQLAYGGPDEYVQKVKLLFQSSFSNIFFNETFSSLNDYHNLLNNGNIFIFGHWREEAEGNILTALYLGKKVYLSCHNPLLEYYRGQGFKLFTLENISNDFYDSLPDSDKESNRSVAENLYSKEKLFNTLKDTFI